ncbi:MAG: hypothetical protein BWY63_00255 [Chloroflexi bacterium ADurb.Bin360]|nr:MAG: hypothetical protein BWY63_00255 [Chloroflexi bacterium ADurb.Bin360]
MPQGVIRQIGNQKGGDVVGHDGRDDLADAQFLPHDCGKESPQCTTQKARRQGQGQVDNHRQFHGVADESAANRANEELPFHPNVEDARAKSQR